MLDFGSSGNREAIPFGFPPPARPIGRLSPGAPSAAALCRTSQELIARVYAVAPGDLRLAGRRRSDLELARQAAMYLANVGVGVSFSDIGRSFSRDRTTVAHACGRIEDLRDDPALDLSLTLLEGALRTTLRLPDPGAG